MSGKQVLHQFAAELKALTREAVKDVRGTLHQVYFNQPEHLSEPGTPLNLTPQEVVAQKTGREVQTSMDYTPTKQREIEMDR